MSVNSTDEEIEENNEAFVTVQINNTSVEMKVDTGAKCNVVPQKTFEQFKDKEQTMCSKPTNLVACGGSKIETHSMVKLQCQLEEQMPHLFSNELGKLPVTYSMTLNPNMRPVVRPAHRIPVAMKDRVKAELDRMQEL